MKTQIRLLVLSWAIFLMHISYAQNTPGDLLTSSNVTHSAQVNGDWSSASTWGGTPPGNFAYVSIPTGVTVTVNSVLSARIKIIEIESGATLRFANDVNTQLNVETIIGLMGSKLEVGTESAPIQADKKALIVFIDEGIITIGNSNQSISLAEQQFEKGAVLMGETEIHGAQKTSWLPLAVQPTIGATSLSLTQIPVGWNEGDELIITGTSADDPRSDETAIIQSISGSMVNLLQPLIKNHTSSIPGFEVHVANITRNVEFRSESAVNPDGSLKIPLIEDMSISNDSHLAAIRDRAHIMFMHSLDVDVNYVRFNELGRTNKRIPLDDVFFQELETGSYITDEGSDLARRNIRGRYSVHFHRGGVNISSTPAVVRGCAVTGDPGWAYVNHSAHVDFIDNVSYRVIGGAYNTEAGDEIGKFTNNIAIHTFNPEEPLTDPSNPESDFAPREGVQDFAYHGDGFWIHGGGVELVGNIVSGANGHGYIYWPEGLIELIGGETVFNKFLVSNGAVENSEALPPSITEIDGWWVKIRKFTDNIVYSATVGWASFYMHTQHFADSEELIEAGAGTYLDNLHSTFENLKIFNVRKTGIQLNFTDRFTFKNAVIINETLAPDKIGIDANAYRNWRIQQFDNCTVKGFGVGIEVPTQGEVTINCGTYNNTTNFRIRNPQTYYRDLLIDGVQIEGGTPIVLNPQFTLQPEGALDLNGTPFNHLLYFLMPDKITLNFGSFNNQRLYWDQQDADYIPITSANQSYSYIYPGEPPTTASIPGVFVNKTNSQLTSSFDGMAFGGGIMPGDALVTSGILGGKISPTSIGGMTLPSCTELFADDFEEGFTHYVAACWGPSPDYTDNIGQVDSGSGPYNYIHPLCSSSTVDSSLCEPGVPVSGLSAIPAANGTNVSLSWNTLINSDLFQAKGKVLGTTAFGQFITTNDFKNIGSLIPGLTYVWKVRARCEDGTMTPFSPLDSFSMPTPKLSVETQKPVTVFPNPAVASFKISFADNFSGNVRIRLEDPNGRLVKQIYTANKMISAQLEVDIKDLLPGIYFLVVQNSNKMHVEKMVIMR